MKNKTSITKGLQLHLDFTQISSTIIPDISGNGYAGVIRNYDAAGVVLQEGDIYGRLMKTILLPGGEGGGYIELPNGILANREGITISFWCKLPSCQEYHTLISFGLDNLLYIKLLYEESNQKITCIPCVSNSGQSQEQSADTKITLNKGRWYQLCVTLEPNLPSHLRYYVDGQLAGQCEQKRVSSLALSKEGNGLIGRGIFGADATNVELADFKIFNRVLSPKEVRDLFCVGDEDCIKADKELLDRSLPTVITQDIVLPAGGQYESVFTYSSSREDILSSFGKVIRPLPGKEDVIADLRVTISHKQEKREYTYQVKVCALPSGNQLLQEDADSLELPELHSIYRDITLPDKGKSGSVILWKSSDPSVLSPGGRVHRESLPGGRKQVELTAVFSYEGMELTKMYTATVLPEYKRKQVAVVPCIEIVTELLVPPVMPNRIWIQYSDGTQSCELVSWSAVTDSNLKEQGIFFVTGHLKSNPHFAIRARILVKNTSGNREIRINQTKPGEVKLLEDTILTQNNKRNLEYLKLLDADRMLYAFRTTFGVDTKNAKPLGGWDEPLGLLRGHSTGHFLSGLALAYGAAKDRVLKNKINYLIDSLRDLQVLSKGKPGEFKTRCTKDNAVQSKWSRNPSEWGEGYLGAYPPDQFVLLEQYATYPTIWAPYYTLHKILAGLLDCYEYVENETALLIACGIGNWVYGRITRCTSMQLEKMWSMYIAGEYGGMNESLSQLYLITKNKKYLEAAGFFDNHKVFNGLAENKDTITSLHANQHIPQMIGALKEYEATGQMHYYRTAYYFWHLVTKHYAYSNGGVGRGENFKEADILAGHIETDRNCETCAAYNMLKLTKSLYCYEPERVEYMDYYERTLFNQIIASQNPIITEHMHHGVTYMLPIGAGQHKEYGSDYHEFTCCHGTGMENHVKYQESIYYTESVSEVLYVNLYIPSRIDWKEQGIILTQAGGYPSEKMTITVIGQNMFTCCLRIPNWCRKGFRVLLNGNEIENEIPVSGYMSLTRSWTDHDILEIYMPYEISLEYTPDNLELPVASVLYGPFVMVAEDSSTNWITLILSPDLHKDFTVVWKDKMPMLFYDRLRFVPMYAAHHMDYHTYFKINLPYID